MPPRPKLSRPTRYLALTAATWCCCAHPPGLVAQDAARFSIPGHDADARAIERLFALHQPQAGPKSTLWDAWLPTPALWPDGPSSAPMRDAWRAALAGRDVDANGYVATHQHPSIAHPSGWPFPFWNQGAGSFGWHFSFEGTVGPPWRKTTLDAADALLIEGGTVLEQAAVGLRLRADEPMITIRLPLATVDTLQAPFVQIRASTGGAALVARVRWNDASGAAQDRAHRVPAAARVATWVLPQHDHPGWRGKVTDLRIELEGLEPGAKLTLRALFSQYDTRHNVNGQAFADGVLAFAAWTGDRAFLAEQLPRVRRAIRHLLDEHGVREHRLVRTTWVGHDGRPGFTVHADGTKTLHPGRGIGNNYWDLLPFGHDDCYATLRLVGTLGRLADLERRVAAHPDWEIPAPGEDLAADALDALRARIVIRANQRFWNEATGRYVACVDADGTAHDYGFTFVNLEAIHEGLAPAERAATILAWIAGERTVAGDTSTGADLYRFRFGPRATTRRNIDWYGWYWHGPESIPFGGQVQDGGAVLGFSYHDLMARILVRGPDDAAARLAAIAAWFRDVEAAGGYRAYYAADPSRGSLQGGGTAGGLGMDQEFFESVLVPQVLVDGFLGLTAHVDALALAPRLPKDWPELTVRGVRYQDWTLDITARHDGVVLEKRDGPAAGPRVLWDGEVTEMAGERIAFGGR